MSNVVELPEPLDVIAVGAHPDDVEIACGGTLARLAEQGYRVGIIDLTDGEPTPISPGPERGSRKRARRRRRWGFISGSCCSFRIGSCSIRTRIAWRWRSSCGGIGRSWCWGSARRRRWPRPIIGRRCRSPTRRFFTRADQVGRPVRESAAAQDRAQLYYTLAFYSATPLAGGGAPHFRHHARRWRRSSRRCGVTRRSFRKRRNTCSPRRAAGPAHGGDCRVRGGRVAGDAADAGDPRFDGSDLWGRRGLAAVGCADVRPPGLRPRVATTRDDADRYGVPPTPRAEPETRKMPT